MTDSITTRARVARRKPGQYAQGTEVPVGKTRAEIEDMVIRAGAKKYTTHAGDDFAAIAFELDIRRVLIRLPLPSIHDAQFTRFGLGGSSGNWRHASEAERERKYEQACRARWRALYLVLRSKLEAIALKIATAEDEFLAYTVLPNQQTVGQWANPQVDEVYATGEMPAMLPGLPSDSSLRALPS